GGVLSTGPPEQEPPLTAHFCGMPVPLTRNPKLAVAPLAIDLFQSWLVAVTCWPLVVRLAFHQLPMLLPDGRSNCTFQPVTVPAVLFVMVYVPWTRPARWSPRGSWRSGRSRPALVRQQPARRQRVRCSPPRRGSRICASW